MASDSSALDRLSMQPENVSVNELGQSSVLIATCIDPSPFNVSSMFFDKVAEFDDLLVPIAVRPPLLAEIFMADLIVTPAVAEDVVRRCCRFEKFLHRQVVNVE